MRETSKLHQVGNWEAARPESARSKIEDDLFALKSIAPESLAQLPTVFEQSVVASINRSMDVRTAGSLLRRLGSTPLGDRFEVFNALDRMAFQRSATLKSAISREFEGRVHAMVSAVVGP